MLFLKGLSGWEQCGHLPIHAWMTVLRLRADTCTLTDVLRPGLNPRFPSELSDDAGAHLAYISPPLGNYRR